ncbi:MAG TPA: hypothetical protein PKW15_02260 [Alphaproteobacteria bacterium]|nr:hypothetical protein [Alphaproteobacteria bacterium]
MPILNLRRLLRTIKEIPSLIREFFSPPAVMILQPVRIRHQSRKRPN